MYDEEEDDYHAEVFPIMGSTREARYQITLEKVMTIMESGLVAPRVKFEPDNPQDVNAIKAEALIDDEWQIFGTIKKKKIPKLTKALRNDEVTQCYFLAAPKYQFNVNHLGDNGFTCKVVIGKRGDLGRLMTNRMFIIKIWHTCRASCGWV